MQIKGESSQSQTESKFHHFSNNNALYRAKIEYLSAAPNINNPGVKGHEKYKQFTDMVSAVSKGGASKGEVKATEGRGH